MLSRKRGSGEASFGNDAIGEARSNNIFSLIVAPCVTKQLLRERHSAHTAERVCEEIKMSRVNKYGGITDCEIMDQRIYDLWYQMKGSE